MSEQAAAVAAKKEEERSSGWSLWILGFMAVFALAFIPKETLAQFLPAPIQAMINKIFGLFGAEPPFPEAEGKVDADLKQTLIKTLGIDDALASAIVKDKETFFKVATDAGAKQEDLIDPNKLPQLLSNPVILKALLTNDQTAAHLVKIVPFGDAAQKQLLEAFKDSSFDFTKLATALKDSKDIKKTLTETVPQLVPEKRMVAIMDEMLKQFGITDQNSITFVKANAGAIGSLIAKLGTDTPAVLGLMTAAKDSKGIDMGKAISLIDKHGKTISEIATKFTVPDAFAPELKAQIQGGLSFLGSQQNVAAITEFVKNSGLAPDQVQKIFTALQSENPKAALNADADLSKLVSTNIPKIGSLLEKLDTSKLDADTKDKLDLLGTKNKDGKYIGLEQLFGVKSASAVQIKSTEVASAVVNKVTVGEGAGTHGLEALTAAMKQSGIALS